jgi:hypothetical protein
MNSLYQNEAEIVAVVRAFEMCVTAAPAFTHQAHLTVATWYLLTGFSSEEAQDHSEDAALDKMRTGLLAFLTHHGVDEAKYNETITAFWIVMISVVLETMETGLSLVDQVNSVLSRLSNPRAIFDYYSPELVSSDEARRGWTNPNRSPLPSSKTTTTGTPT